MFGRKHKQMCSGCGRPDCADPKSADEVREYLRQVIELGRTIGGLPDDLIDYMAEMLDSVPDEILPELYRAEAEATLGSRGEEFFNTGEVTAVLIGPDGVKTIGNGNRLVPADISFIDPAIIADIESVVAQTKALRAKAEQVRQLRREVAELQTEVARGRTQLRHALWQQFPRYKGNRDLVLCEEGSVVRLDDGYGRHLEVIEGETGTRFITRQKDLDAKESTSEDKTRQADALQKDVELDPELLKTNQEAADETLHRFLKKHNHELWEQLRRGEARVVIDKDGKVGILVREEFEEESDEVPPMIREIMAVRAKYDKVLLPDFVKKAIGLPADKAPVLEDNSADSDFAAPPAEFTGATTEAETRGRNIVP